MARQGPEPPEGSGASESVSSFLRAAVDISEPSSTTPVSLGLTPGDVLSDRFMVERLAGAGGMGTIHRGTDMTNGSAVAIKVMTSAGTGDANRFAQEAVVLAELSHPAIVRYVAHGATPEGARFLAMEWLEGEDLAERLARSALTVDESLVLLRRACEGVAVAHARGVVHRDLKPSNLFLVDGCPAALKVLDFGVARHRAALRTLTQPGTLLGTVGYMSPEQAMGSREVDGRADVFALGCVLFECLTGRAAFTGSNAIAVLAKVLREEAPRVSELRPGLGVALDDLVARMLAKDPGARPIDAEAVLHALEALPESLSLAPAPSPGAGGVTETEQKIVSVILGKPQTHAAAITPAQEDAELRRVQDLTAQFGLEPVSLRGGGLLIILSGRASATDLAGQAATCALLLKQARPDLHLCVATGRAETTGRVPVGAAIDRAAELLVRSPDTATDVSIDELTAGLLHPTFEVRREGEELLLFGKRSDTEAVRLLMGKPTPFVGRAKELGLLELTLRECADESVAHAVLVTGPPGQGKSRLRCEFVAKVRERGGVKILTALADPVGAGSSFNLARQLVRQAAGLQDTASAVVQSATLRAYVGEVCSGTHAARIADFLGELVAVPSPDRPSPELRAARNDPQIMNVWLRRSFEEWLGSECAAGPVLVVLEDLHWGDLPSVTFLGDALLAPGARALMVLALGRPEMHDAFPRLWNGAAQTDVPLRRLTQRAAEQLVQAALGEQLSAESVARLVDRADGNAFYLEELIRRFAEGDSETLPETVMAVAQSRLERLEPEARRVVRAASVFGEVFWGGGVAAVLGESGGTRNLDAWLEVLSRSEVCASGQESRYAGQREYRFRHGLLREAAYAMLTDGDRMTGHTLAGDWLERAGEGDALTLAEHFDAGGQPGRAVTWLMRASRIALDSGNLRSTIALGDRALTLGAQGIERGELLRLQGAAFTQLGDPIQSIAVGRPALELLAASSPEWLLCASNLFYMGALLGDRTLAIPLLQAITSGSVEPEATGIYGTAVANTCSALAGIGELASARLLLEQALAVESGATERDPSYGAMLGIAQGRLLLVMGNPARAIVCLSEARAFAETIQHEVVAAAAQCLLVAAYAELGNSERARACASKLTALCEPRGMRFYSERGNAFLAASHIEEHRASDAIAILHPLTEQPDRLLAASARARLALAYIAAGDWAAASLEADAAFDAGSMFPSTHHSASAALALVAIHFGRPRDALDIAERSLEQESGGVWLLDGSVLRLARVEALHALGRTGDAHVALRQARDRILNVAATLEDPELRHSYTTRVAVNARTLELAGEWLGVASS